MALLEIRGLVKEFDGKRVLDGIDMDLEAGQVKLVMGSSGCGKSTLLRCINRLIEPTSGQIVFNGQSVTDPSVDVRMLRQRIGFVFQNFVLYRHLNARENVTLGLRKLRGLAAQEANERAMQELARMSMETPMPRSIPRSSPVVGNSASRLRGPWQWTRGCCSSTSRPPRSTRAWHARSSP